MLAYSGARGHRVCAALRMAGCFHGCFDVTDLVAGSSKRQVRQGHGPNGSRAERAAAGLGTFRGADGRWTLAPELERAMHAEYVPDNIQQLWTVWGGLRQRARQAGPTVGHRVLAKLAPTIITQNVDGLHTDAGSQGFIELHGSAARARCLSAQCGWTGPADD